MSLAEEKLNIFRQNAQAFIYAFIAENSIGKFNARIAQKRLEQIDYINRQAKTLSFGLTVNDIKEAIADGIIEQYGMKPAQLLYALAQGKTVRNRRGVAFVAGIGTPLTAIDKKTGFPAGASVESNGLATVNGEQYYKVMDTENNRGEAVFNEQGQQVAYYSGGEWKQGTNNSKNFWSWANAIISGLSRLLEAIGRFFGGGKRIDDFRPLQQDGFYFDSYNTNQQAGSGILLPALVGCGIAYAIWNEGNKDNKEKKTNK